MAGRRWPPSRPRPPAAGTDHARRRCRCVRRSPLPAPSRQSRRRAASRPAVRVRPIISATPPPTVVVGLWPTGELRGRAPHRKAAADRLPQRLAGGSAAQDVRGAQQPVEVAGGDRLGLAREVVVERARRDADRLGDVFDPDLVVAALDGEPDRGPSSAPPASRPSCAPGDLPCDLAYKKMRITQICVIGKFHRRKEAQTTTPLGVSLSFEATFPGRGTRGSGAGDEIQQGGTHEVGMLQMDGVAAVGDGDLLVRPTGRAYRPKTARVWLIIGCGGATSAPGQPGITPSWPR